jgi:fructose-1,6-bisphosphatase/inositol monophosphatase family enzyme
MSLDEVDGEPILQVLYDTADAIRLALDGLDDWGLAGTRAGQYRSDLVADETALRILDAAGFGVMSEESGAHNPGRDLVVIMDPVDGSTNASRRLPWYATSLCALDASGPLAAVVVNQATGMRFDAARGAGARCDGHRIAPTGCTELGQALVAVNGYPSRHLGWKQFRALGAAALDLCAVACGSLDAYLDCTRRSHGPWDYLGGMLVCEEAGAVVLDVFDEELVVRGHHDRRTPLAAATPALAKSLLQACREASSASPNG